MAFMRALSLDASGRVGVQNGFPDRHLVPFVPTGAGCSKSGPLRHRHGFQGAAIDHEEPVLLGPDDVVLPQRLMIRIDVSMVVPIMSAIS